MEVTSASDLSLAPLPCPSCGYDLRAATTNLCSECGQTFNPETLAKGTLPWLHRETLGRWRAFWRTTDFILRKPSQLHQALGAVPNDLAARSYSRHVLTCTIVLLGLGCLALSNTGSLSLDPTYFLSLSFATTLYSTPSQFFPPRDLWLPPLFLLGKIPLLAILLVLTCLPFASSLAAIVTGGFVPHRFRARVIVASRYGVASLLFYVVLMGINFVWFFIADWVERGARYYSSFHPAVIGSFILLAAAETWWAGNALRLRFSILRLAYPTGGLPWLLAPVAGATAFILWPLTALLTCWAVGYVIMVLTVW